MKIKVRFGTSMSKLRGGSMSLLRSVNKEIFILCLFALIVMRKCC